MKQLKNFRANQVPQEVSNNPSFNAALDKYGNMGEDALIEQLIMQVANAKKSGTYNATQMQAYISMISPHLNQAQKTKLENVLKVIEAEK